MLGLELDPDALADMSDDDLHRLANDIHAIIYTRAAARQRTRLEHHPGDPAEHKHEEEEG